MYKVGIIGIGSIAEGYGKPSDPNAYCHSGGILHSKQVELVGVADLDEERRTRFRNKWGASFPAVAYYDSAAAMLATEPLDIVAVCVRGPHHYQVMMEVLATAPRAVFLEKPPTCSLAEMDELVALAGDIPIVVSYSRHWAPHVLYMQRLVEEGLIGEVKSVVGYVGGGVLSFASHLSDLICQFAGYCPQQVVAQGTFDQGEVPDGFEPEPQLQGMLIQFANGVSAVHVGQSGDHGGFYCDVVGMEGKVRVGMYIEPKAWNKENAEIELQVPEKQSVFTVAYGQIADYLDGGPLPHCTNANFIAVHELGFAAIESMVTGQRVEIPVQNRTRKIYANG